MKRLILLLCFLLSSSSIWSQSFKGKSKEKISVEKFILAPFTEIISKDSMKSVLFLETPFSSLQFVKKGSEYVSYYQASISMKIDKGKNILIAAHGNSLRAMMIELGIYKPEEISNIELPTGSPLCINLDQGRLVDFKYLD